MVALQVSIRERSVRPIHVKGRCIVYPDLPGDFNPDPFNDGTTMALALTMVPLRQLRASTGGRSRSKKIPTKGEGSYIVLRTQIACTSVSPLSNDPSRSSFGSAARAASMDCNVGTFTTVPI